MSCIDVGHHHPLAFLVGQNVPLAGLEKWIDHKVFCFPRPDADAGPFLALVPMFADVLGPASHCQIRVWLLKVSSHLGLIHTGHHILKFFQSVTRLP